MVKKIIRQTGKRAARKVGDYAREKPAVTASFVLHALLLFFVAVGMPILWKHKKPPLPNTVNIDILPIRDKTNVKPQEEAPKPEEKKEDPKPKPVKTVQEKVEEKKPEPAPKPKEKEKPKAIAKPKEKPKPPKEKPKPKEKKEDDFAAVLKSVEKMKSTQPEKKKQESDYDPTAELSASLADAIATSLRNTLDPLWDIPAGARDADKLEVAVTFTVTADGKAKNVEIVRSGSDAASQAAAEAAVRAVYLADFKDMVVKYKKEYDKWKEVRYTFTTRDVF